MDDFSLPKRSRPRQVKSRRSISLDEYKTEAPPPSPEPESNGMILEEPMMSQECQNELASCMEQMVILDPQQLRESLQRAFQDTVLAGVVDDGIPRYQSAPMSMPGIGSERVCLDLHLPSIDSSTESSPPIQSSPACGREYPYTDFRSRHVFDCQSLPTSLLSAYDASSPFRERSSSLKRMRDDSCLDGQELACSVPKRCRLLEDFSLPSEEEEAIY